MGNCLDSENVSHMLLVLKLSHVSHFVVLLILIYVSHIGATHLALPRDTQLSERHKAVHRLAGLWSGFGFHVVFHVWAELTWVNSNIVLALRNAKCNTRYVHAEYM